MPFSIQFDVEKLKSNLNKRMDKVVKTAGTKALNDSAKAAIKSIVNTTVENTGLQRGSVNSQIKLTKANETHPYSIIRISTAGIALDKFSPKQEPVMTRLGLRQAVSVKVGKSTRQIIPNAFLATRRGGSKALVLSRKNVNSSASRPTKRLFFVNSPIIQAIKSGAGFDKIRDIVYATFENVFKSEFNSKIEK